MTGPTPLAVTWRAVWHFIGGLAAFSILTAVIVAYHILVAWAKAKGLSNLEIVGLTGVEYLAYFVDVLLFAIFLVWFFWLFIRELPWR